VPPIGLVAKEIKVVADAALADPAKTRLTTKKPDMSKQNDFFILSLLLLLELNLLYGIPGFCIASTTPFLFESAGGPNQRPQISPPHLTFQWLVNIMKQGTLSAYSQWVPNLETSFIPARRRENNRDYMYQFSVAYKME